MSWNRHPKNQFGRRNVDMVTDWWPESSLCFFRIDLHEFSMEPIPGGAYVKALSRSTEAKRCPESRCAQFKADGSGRDWRNAVSTPRHYHLFIALPTLLLLLSTAAYLAISLGRADISTDVSYANYHLQGRRLQRKEHLRGINKNKQNGTSERRAPLGAHWFAGETDQVALPESPKSSPARMCVCSVLGPRGVWTEN